MGNIQGLRVPNTCWLLRNFNPGHSLRVQKLQQQDFKGAFYFKPGFDFDKTCNGKLCRTSKHKQFIRAFNVVCNYRTINIKVRNSFFEYNSTSYC